MCVDFGLLDLDEPIGKWAPQTQEAGSTLRQLLAHASPGANPAFKYDPSRFAALAIPLEACGDEPYRKLIADYILDRLAMIDAVPGRDVTTAPVEVRTLVRRHDARTLRVGPSPARHAVSGRSPRPRVA